MQCNLKFSFFKTQKSIAEKQGFDQTFQAANNNEIIFAVHKTIGQSSAWAILDKNQIVIFSKGNKKYAF